LEETRNTENKFGGKHRLGRPRRKQYDNIKMDAEINCESVRWVE
jgi:hypothetical protein